MRLMGRASLRYHARHPAQLALSVLGVALGVAVVVSIDLAIQSSREAFQLSAETVSGRATHTIVGAVRGLDDDLLARLKVEGWVRQAAPVVEGVASSPALPGMALRILGVDPFSEGPFRPLVTGGPSGVDVSAFLTVPGAVILSGPTAADAGVGLGDTLPVRVNGRDRYLPVVGLLEPADRLARVGLRDLLLLDIASAQELLGRPGAVSRIDLRLPDSPEGATTLDAIRSILPADARIEAAGARTAALSGMIAAFDLNLTALSLLALVFGMFLIYNAMTFSVVQRREILGSLRALGVTRGEVLGCIVWEALWIGLAGALVGVLLGVVLGRELVQMVTRTINDLYFVVTVDGLSVPPAVLAKGILLGLGTTVLASLPPALEAGASPPRVAQTRSAVEVSARRAVPRAALVGLVLSLLGGLLLAVPTRNVPVSFVGLFFVILGMALLTPLGTVALVGVASPLLRRTTGILGTMAARGVVTALSRTAPAVAALAVAVSVTVGLGVMIGSFRSTLTRWLAQTLQADVYVSLPSAQASRADGTLDPALLGALTSHPAVAGWSSYRGVELDTPDGSLRVVALDLDPRGEAAFDFKVGGGTATFRAFREEGAVLISEPMAFRLSLAVGDSVSLPGARGRGRFPVAGIFFDYGSDQGVVMVSRTAFDQAFDDPGITSLGLFLREDVDAEAVVGELTARAPPGQAVVIRTNAALREGSLEVFERTFRVTAVLRLLAFVVAFVGVLSALMALQLERARELGVLRANGMTPGQVWKLITTQTALMGVVSGILAVPMGLVLSTVMIFVVNKRSFGWTLRMDVGPGIVVEAVALAVVGAVLAGVYPAWRMARTSPAEALRGE